MSLVEQSTAKDRLVLVVEDNPLTLDALVSALSDEGYRVSRAVDGMDAIGEVQQEVPDLVIADVHMPRMSGGQLVRRLRKWNVPVILLSADTNWSRTAGVVFVPKPFDLDHLLEVVAHLLDDRNE
ncbi:MAG: response regulator [Chloroflexota bacterium]|nr:response regulator [Chloroflexota bacterium]